MACKINAGINLPKKIPATVAGIVTYYYSFRKTEINFLLVPITDHAAGETKKLDDQSGSQCYEWIKFQRQHKEWVNKTAPPIPAIMAIVAMPVAMRNINQRLVSIILLSNILLSLLSGTDYLFLLIKFTKA